MSEPKAEAKVRTGERARAYLDKKKSFKQGQVAFGEAGWHYYWFDFGPSKKGLQKSELMRFELRDREFEAVNGPLYDGKQRAEIVVGVPTAEIWRCKKEVADIFFRARLVKNLSDRTWKRFQQGRIQSAGAFVPSL